MSTGGPLGQRPGGGTEKIESGWPDEGIRAGPGQPQGRDVRRLATILRSIPVMVFSLDAGGLITSISEAGVDMIDTSSVDMVGRSVFELIPAPRTRRQIHPSLAGHRAAGVQAGRPVRYFKTYLDPVFDRAGTLREVLGVSLDVTE